MIQYSKWDSSPKEGDDRVRRLALELKDKDLRPLANLVSVICFSEEFLMLKKELEQIYSASGVDNPVITAFQDSLYAILCQYVEETAANKCRAL